MGGVVKGEKETRVAESQLHGEIIFADRSGAIPKDELRKVLGGKGAALAEMATELSLPVPPAFTIATGVCNRYLASGWPDGLDNEIASAMSELEDRTGRTFGDPENPLLVSVRSGASVSMPGMLDTVLNLGVNSNTMLGLQRAIDDRFALDCRRRFLESYAKVVMGVRSDFGSLVEEATRTAGVSRTADLSVAELGQLLELIESTTIEEAGKPVPEDPYEQLFGAVRAVFESWLGDRAVAFRRREGLSDEMGTACTIQAMVFGNRSDLSGTGVAFTRDPTSGEAVATGDFLLNAQGEDVVAGSHTTLPLSALADYLPGVASELDCVLNTIENHYRDLCDVEFTVEEGRLYILQTRSGKRTGKAALRIAAEMVSDKEIRLTRAEALRRITPAHIESVLRARFVDAEESVLARGLAASPGAAVGRAVMTPAEALASVGRGERVILVRHETSAEDVEGMAVAEGILTARGGLVSHAALVARGWGIPCVSGVTEMTVADDHFAIGDVKVSEGDFVSIDGTTGAVVLGEREVAEADSPPELEVVLAWCDEVCSGSVELRANADTPADARKARSLGATGIGLCRTEHMFLASDRLALIRAVILSDSEEAAQTALTELGTAQRQDFEQILEAMDGLPVTVRLLDPPLHEFLPDLDGLMIADALGQLDEEGGRLLKAARQWAETNPMIGTRGVRLAHLFPGLYRMQASALFHAVRARRDAGGQPKVEVMIPLTISGAELAEAREWVTEAAIEAGLPDSPTVGTMIETPRAALVADELAEYAEFFSIGSNDLTQMTFGFSRDDVGGRFLSLYLEKGLIAADPFEHLDHAGVGKLINVAVERGRRTRPDLIVGVCGEHAGDPASMRYLIDAGVNYLSCSPARLPVARLAAARIILDSKKTLESGARGN